MDNNRPLTDREKWQQAERLLRDMSRECAKMNGDIHDLRAELAALREAKRWIPVDERLPPAGVEVLIYCAPPLAPYWVGEIRKDGVWVGSGGVAIRHRAIAWRHLPAPPEVSP